MAALDEWALERMNVPTALWGAEYAQVSPEHQTAIRRYCAKIDDMLGRGVGFFIFGDAGTGKSSLAAVLLKASWERDKSCYYTSVKDLRYAVKSESKFDNDEYVLDRCKNIDVLVLEDFSADDIKPFTLSLGEIEHLLRTRAMRSKTTIFTARMPLEQMQLECGDLLRCMNGSFIALHCMGEDRKRLAQIALNREFGVG